MAILGIGIDIINNSRIKKLSKNTKFINKIFSIDEINISKNIKNQISFFSKRFAAKEAFSKAIGTGIRNNLRFNDISISNKNNGKPYIKITNRLKQIIKKRFKTKNVNILLSLSDEKKYSIAYVVIEKK